MAYGLNERWNCSGVAPLTSSIRPSVAITRQTGTITAAESRPFGTSTITNCTITNNSVLWSSQRERCLQSLWQFTLRNNIIAANQNNATRPDVLADLNTGITSNGYNFIGNRGTVSICRHRRPKRHRRGAAQSATRSTCE